MEECDLDHADRLSRGVWALLVGTAFATFLGGSAPALAGQRHNNERQSDYYAYAGSDDATAQPVNLTHGGGCFVTLSPTEAARGIRHFREKC